MQKKSFANEQVWQRDTRQIDLYVTNSRLNESTFRHRLDPISKNVIKNQNPIQLLFKDVKHFNAQNPVIGSLIREVDNGRKKDQSKFLDKAPDIRRFGALV